MISDKEAAQSEWPTLNTLNHIRQRLLIDAVYSPISGYSIRLFNVTILQRLSGHSEEAIRPRAIDSGPKDSALIEPFDLSRFRNVRKVRNEIR